MSTKDIIEEISKVADRQLTLELLREYDLAKRSHFLEDWEKAILHAGKFTELVLATIKSIVDKITIDINDIHFDKLCNDFMNRTKTCAKDETLMLAIPTVAKSVYTIRSKRRVAHIKAIDPTFLDSQYCISACDWILSEVLTLFATSRLAKDSSLVYSVMEKQVPFVEQFEDGSLVILKDGLSFKEQLAVALYKLGRRVTKKELVCTLKTYAQLLNAALKSLEEGRFIHVNEGGATLTKKGLKFVEDELLKR